MTLQDAYAMVFQDLKRCSLYCGNYNAKYGNEHFMYGVGCVMESIASHISDEVADDFSSQFTHNMIESEEKYKEVS